MPYAYVHTRKKKRFRPTWGSKIKSLMLYRLGYPIFPSQSSALMRFPSLSTTLDHKCNKNRATEWRHLLRVRVTIDNGEHPLFKLMANPKLRTRNRVPDTRVLDK
jgi:hypothetical protein